MQSYHKAHAIANSRHTSHYEDLSKTEFEIFNRMKRAKIAPSEDEASANAQDEKLKEEVIMFWGSGRVVECIALFLGGFFLSFFSES